LYKIKGKFEIKADKGKAASHRKYIKKQATPSRRLSEQANLSPALSLISLKLKFNSKDCTLAA